MALELPKDHFSELLRVFAGRRVPLDGMSSKVLRFMLERPDGCDAVLEPGRIEIRFGWHPARHRYQPSVAPRIASYLLDLAKTRGETRAKLRAVIGPASVPAIDFLQWSFEARRIWIEQSDLKVVIFVRSAEATENPESTDALPEPIDFPAPVFVEFSTAVACPACGAGGTVFREFDGGFLVCGNCGNSFAKPEWDAAEQAVAALVGSASKKRRD
jgi:ribosomal protein L37AE/L43A